MGSFFRSLIAALIHSPSAIKATLQCHGVVDPVLVLSRLMDTLCSPVD